MRAAILRPRCSIVTCGVVWVCTKSGGFVTRVSVVVATVGTFGTEAVVSVGATFGAGGAFLLRHAGTSAAAITINPTQKPFTTLFMVSIIAFAHSDFFDQSGSLFSPANVSCDGSVPSVRMRKI